MANYLKGKNYRYYSKHSNRSESRMATKGERTYSCSWLSGFHSIWDNDGFHDISHCKTPFEKTAFKRGQNFAKKVLAE